MGHLSRLLPAVLGGLLVSASPEQSAFLGDILAVYGQDGLLDHNGINSLLDTIAQENRGENQPVLAQCLSGEEILTHYGLSNLTHLNQDHLGTICPALLNQGLLPSCTLLAAESHTHIEGHVWGYGFLAVTIINLFSLLGLVLIPATKKPYFPKILTYFIGLAIGTLFSNAALQLIPEAFGFDPKKDDYISKAVGIFGGFYMLFFTEKVLKMLLKTESEHDQSHFSLPESPQQNGGTIIAVTSFSTPSSEKTSIASAASEEQVTAPPQESCLQQLGQRLATVKTVAWMITLSDALHNFIDGLAIGASFTVSVLTGFSTSIAIVCEEFPHELGDFVILLSAGMSIPQAIFFNLLSAMSCYVGLVLGILLGSRFAPNVIFALAGGMFLYIALADMFPEMNAIAKAQQQSRRTELVFFLIQNAGLLTGFLVILLITMFAGNINLG
ncbi:metal cation symporter ZIP8 [Pygocentrus nattereri]|uniref:Zinc transporter ZIP8 n=1 Tax=Pygocentrus nattereri TaxID=42514 RepID=A0A3B4DTZ2_PYGNA|nr:metal cation symporter ZIP8 [Pygocentrus nattereri]XP_037400491.1 metal cation symporter ZIP8 [Pygocentrus nattereri]